MAIQFKLNRISIPQFAILKDEAFANPLRVDYEVNFSIDDQIQSIRNSLKISYLNGEEPVMVMVIECYFDVAPASWKEMTQENGNIVIPDSFLQHLATVTLGAARGAQFAKTEATNLNNYTVPLMNLTEIVKNDMIVTPKTVNK
ncbi:MAG: hypothetical protein HUJ92_01030 [Bacteroidales bacterium]|nr:hypothetical protein [Bacteroidales bacterium]